MIMAHQFQLLFTDCNYPKGFMVWIGFHGILFLFLFSDFYKASYVNKRAKAKAKAKMEAASVSISCCYLTNIWNRSKFYCYCPERNKYPIIK
jgi:hypothetical protein